MTDDSTAHQSRDTLLARRFVALADTLVDDYDVVDLLDRLVTDCVDLLNVTAAGILLTDQRGNLQLMASSSEESRVLELFQLEDRDGPCLDSIRTSSPVTVTDAAEMERRWPRFAVAARASGYTSVHAFPMRLREETIGALNLFGSRSSAIAVDEQQIAQALADVATIGILQQRSIHLASLVAEQLQVALNTRIVVEQAKGVLAEFARVDMPTAFTALRSYARGSNQKIGLVADALVRRVLPPEEVLPPSR
jgi:transcriptional regulator with GAF, ATPase, and Fis domain